MSRERDQQFASIGCAVLLSSLLHLSAALAAPQKLGVLLPLSGDYAAVGDDCRKGIDAALTTHPSLTRFDILYGDTQAEAKQSVAEFNKMVNTSRIDVALAVRGPVGMAVNPLSAQRKIPLLGAVGHADFAAQNPYAFQFWPPATQEGPALARLIGRQQTIAGRPLNVAILTGEDEWLLSFSKALEEELKSLGAEVVLHEKIAPSQLELQSLISRVASLKPDAVVVNLSISQIPIALKRLREQRVPAQTYSNFWVAKGEVIKAAGPEAIEGTRYVEMCLERPLFKEALLRATGSTKASAMTLSCFTALSALAGAEKAISAPSNLFTTLSALTSVDVADGSVPIRGRQAIFPLCAKRIRNGLAVEGDRL